MTGRGPVLVVGATGGVGGYLLRELARYGPVVGTHATNPAPSTVPLDAADPNQVAALLDEWRPRAVVVAAALANVDRCEQAAEESHRANALAPGTLARECAARGLRLVHLSTDYVFDGRDGPYAEDAPTAPINAYGRDKLLGERLVAESGASAVVLRTSVVYGGAQPGAVDLVVRTLSAGRRLALSDRHHNSPTDVADLAAIVRAALDCGRAGVYHVAGPQTMTRFAFGRAVAEAFGLPVELVEPAPDGPQPGRVPRPERCGLLIDRAARDFGYRPATLAAGLARRYPAAVT